MKKKLLTPIIIAICLLLAAIDFVANDYGSSLNLTASIFNLTDSSKVLIQKVEREDSNLKVAQEIETQNLFNKINLEKVEAIQKTKEVLFNKNNVPYVKFYILEFNSKEHAQNFLTIKKLFTDLEKQVDAITINETNDYGSASFYVNDTENETTATFVTLTQDGVWGIEYSKETASSLKELLQKITSTEI